MKKIIFTLLLSLLVASPSYAGKSTMIEKSALHEMFNNIRTKTKWNIDKNMVWGYFFTAPTKAALMGPSQELASLGYKLVEIFQAEDKSAYWLHVERIETHSVESLHQRNLELYEFASKFKGVEYDGMDVGPTTK